jgi:hypothetical protein
VSAVATALLGTESMAGPTGAELMLAPSVELMAVAMEFMAALGMESIAGSDVEHVGFGSRRDWIVTSNVGIAGPPDR